VFFVIEQLHVAPTEVLEGQQGLPLLLAYQVLTQVPALLAWLAGPL
jgi:hypothetical protein